MRGVKTRETSVSVIIGTYTEVSHLVEVLNQTHKNAAHKDIVFNCLRAQSRIQVTVAGGKTLWLKKGSPSLILSISEIAALKSWDCSGGKAGVVKTLLYAVDLSASRRAVLLYTDLIYPAVEYEDNSDSRVLKTFLVSTLDGINNFVFAKNDLLLLRPSCKLTRSASG